MAAETILVLGESGAGKSTSLRTLNPKETFIISTTSKPLPWRGWKRIILNFLKKIQQVIGSKALKLLV